GPRPFAERARETPVEKKGWPVLLVEAVATHADRHEIGVTGSLQEMPRQRHAVLERNLCLFGRMRHGVHKQFARQEVALRHCWAGKPVLFIGTNARSVEITHPADPKTWVSGHVAGHRILCPIRTAFIDPTIMRNERHP